MIDDLWNFYFILTTKRLECDFNDVNCCGKEVDIAAVKYQFFFIYKILLGTTVQLKHLFSFDSQSLLASAGGLPVAPPLSENRSHFSDGVASRSLLEKLAIADLRSHLPDRDKNPCPWTFALFRS
jgi:hypothetical protein